MKRWVRVGQEGNAEQYIISDDEEDAEEGPTHRSNQNRVDEGDLIENDVLFSASNCAQDIAMVQDMGLGVDNNNKPSPKNIPKPVSHPRTTVEKNYAHEEVGWGWSGIDHRKCLNIQN